MSRKWNEETINNYINVIEPKYKVLKFEIRFNGKINQNFVLLQCDKNHSPYWTQFCHFKDNHRCPSCAGLAKKTTEEYKNEVEILTNNEYTINEEYVNNKIKIEHFHFKCNYKFKMAPNSFLSGERCPKCQGKMRKDTNIYKELVYELVEDDYTVLSEYTNCEDKVLHRHNKCNHEFNMSPTLFLQGQRCPDCRFNKKKTNEKFTQEVYELVNDEYDVLDYYINNFTKIRFRHNICNNIFKMAPDNFINQNQRCPICRQSKGETYVFNWLKQINNIEIKRQYVDKSLKSVNGGVPRFDFAIIKDYKIYCIIEVDGAGHRRPLIFRASKKYDPEQQFVTMQQNDQIKNEYCKNKKIKLIRLNYEHKVPLPEQFDDILYYNFKDLINKEVI